MKITSDSTGNSFTKLQVQTRSKLTDAAQQFEAMLMQEMLKPMRSQEGGWSGDEKTDSASDTISSFGTEAVAQAISKGGGLGIARQVVAKISAERQTAQKRT
jgi:peptidoglycan hydrolase FlgJ